MTTALASLLSGRPVKHTVGMTGEVTLQGRVLPIGGLKQKVLAGARGGAHRRDHPRAQPRRPRRRPRGRQGGDVVPPGDDARRGARARARARCGPSACAVVAARRSPRRSAARRTSSSGAGRSRSSGPRTRAPSASTSSCRRSARSRRRRSPRGSSSSRRAGILERATIVEGRPPRNEYRLTPLGSQAPHAWSDRCARYLS